MTGKSIKEGKGLGSKLETLFSRSKGSSAAKKPSNSDQVQTSGPKSAQQADTPASRRLGFINTDSMYFGNSVDVRGRPPHPPANLPPPQPVARTQPYRSNETRAEYLRHAFCLRDGNNVSPVSFSAERRPVSPISRAQAQRSDRATPPVSSRLATAPANSLQRSNAIRRRRTDVTGDNSRPELYTAPVHRRNTTLTMFKRNG